MTEDESKSAVKAAKARIAQHTDPKSAEPADRVLLKKDIEEDRNEHDNALIAQTDNLQMNSTAQITEQSVYKEYEQAYADKNNLELDEYRHLIQETADRLATPCTGASTKFRIGNWNKSIADAAGYVINVKNTSYNLLNTEDNIETKDHPEKPDEYIDHTSVEHKPHIEGESFLAFYNLDNGMIYLNEYNEEEKEKATEEREKYGSHSSNEYITGNPVAQNNVFFHEMNHKIDHEYNGGKQLYTTPINSVRENRLTETKSCAVEYLAAAQQYMALKQAGAKTFYVNGENRPLESILEAYPGLKEVVEKNGFDASDPKSVRNVVEAASKMWHQKKERNYEKQEMRHAAYASSIFAKKTISEQLDFLKNEDKDYEKISKKMLQNTYIGQNTVVDLTGCRDLLDTLNKETFTKVVQSYQTNATPQSDSVMNNINLISYDELKAVNDHLESKGLSTDVEKGQYLQDALYDICRRSKNQDKELKNILLAYNPTMIYADGMSEGTFAGMRIVTDREGHDCQISDKTLAEATARQNKGKALEDNMPTITLSSMDMPSLHEEFTQQRQEHDSELNRKTAELTEQKTTKKTAQQTPNTTANNISPSTIMRMQQSCER